MTMQYNLNEDKIAKLPVILSTEVEDLIETIDFYNRFNANELIQFYYALDGVIQWLSNTSIAWDNTNIFRHFNNGTTYFESFGFKMTYIIKVNKTTQHTFVYVITLKFNFEDYGLQIPSYITENNNTKTQYNMKQKIRLTEGGLHRIIRGCVNEALNELDWRTYASAAKEAEIRGDKRKEAFLNAATNSLKNKFPNRHYNITSYPAGKDTPDAMPDFHHEEWFNPYLNTKYGYMNANSRADNAACGPHFDYQGEYHKSFGDRGVKGWGKSIVNHGQYGKEEEPSSIPTSNDHWDVKTHKGSHQGDWDTPTDNEGDWDWNAMSDDMENYYTGKSHYDKNKGEWVVDEAISKAIKKVLNESYRRMF